MNPGAPSPRSRILRSVRSRPQSQSDSINPHNQQLLGQASSVEGGSSVVFMPLDQSAQQQRLPSLLLSRRRSDNSSTADSPASPPRSKHRQFSPKSSAHKTNPRSNLVYLDGPQVYACAQCRTHLTSHDDIISKSFYGRHGRAYLIDNCVNYKRGTAEDRRLMTGLHQVADVHCIHCDHVIGWTYLKAYDHGQKYKEGKFVIEKINLFMEQEYSDVHLPAMERVDKFRKRSMSWCSSEDNEKFIYEYPRSETTTAAGTSSSSFSDVNNNDVNPGSRDPEFPSL